MSWTTVLTTTAVLALLAGCFSCALPSDELADARKIEAEATAFEHFEHRAFRLCADEVCNAEGTPSTRWSGGFRANQVDCYCGAGLAATFYRPASPVTCADAPWRKFWGTP